MFDPEGKRGKTIEKRRAEHKARRGVKGAKVPAYKKEEVIKEVSKKTLGSYIKKASTDMATSAVKGDYDKTKKRQSGVLKAVDKMTKEEVIKEKDGLWDNIHQKRERMKKGSGEKKAKKGDKDYPKTLNVEGIMGMVKRAAKVKAKKTTGRDAGAIAAKIMRDKEQKKYVSFLPANESVGAAVTDTVINDKKVKSEVGGVVSDAIRGKRNTLRKIRREKPLPPTNEAIKYDSKGSSMDYFLGADPKKTKEYKALKKKKTQKEGTSYGLYKGSGKASGAMKDYLDKKAKMLTKKRNKQSDAAKNNPHFDSTQPSPSGRNKYEEVQRDGYGDPIGGPKISKKQKAKNLASNTPDEQHTTTTSEAVTFQHFMEKCWKGYEKKGMKTMFGKRYPNCVKKEEVELTDEGLSLIHI